MLSRNNVLSFSIHCVITKLYVKYRTGSAQGHTVKNHCKSDLKINYVYARHFIAGLRGGKTQTKRGYLCEYQQLSNFFRFNVFF